MFIHSHCGLLMMMDCFSSDTDGDIRRVCRCIVREERAREDGRWGAKDERQFDRSLHLCFTSILSTMPTKHCCGKLAINCIIAAFHQKRVGKNLVLDTTPDDVRERVL